MKKCQKTNCQTKMSENSPEFCPIHNYLNKQITTDQVTHNPLNTVNEEDMKKFDNEFPNKMSEVIDDFGSPIKSEIKSFLLSSNARTAKAVIEAVMAEIGVDNQIEKGDLYAMGELSERSRLRTFLQTLLDNTDQKKFN